jgi:hypothetical protein
MYFDTSFKTSRRDYSDLSSPRLFMRFEFIYESKREPKIRGMNKCRCDERLQTYSRHATGFFFFQERDFFLKGVEMQESDGSVDNVYKLKRRNALFASCRS